MNPQIRDKFYDEFLKEPTIPVSTADRFIL